ncbi:hypothetical protein TWF751_006135 [Orbilia oligospora]|nr:hypothetical protein TWF751_006135 [Orbilia oligospora]
MNLLHEWIKPDLEAELQRLEEASQQLRNQRNSAQINRSRKISKYLRLKAAAKAEYQAQLKSDPKSKPILESIPKPEHCKLSYDDTLVAPIDWSPPRHIQSPLRETKHYVQIVQLTSEVDPEKPFNAVVTDGHVSIPALFKVCSSWTAHPALIETGAVFQIRRYIFRFPGSCSKSWEEGLTRNDQLSLARSSRRGPKRPKSLKYPSIAASIGAYQWENNFLPADGLLLEIEISKIIPTAESQHDISPPSIEDNWKLMDIVNQFPVLPIRIPGLDLWSTEIIEEVAGIWYGEIAWYRFSQSVSPRQFRKLPSIKTTFLKRLQTESKIKTAVRRARRNVFESIYHTEGPIGGLFEIRQAYRILQLLLKNKPQTPVLRIPGTNRPLQNQGYSTSPEEDPEIIFQSQETTTGTPQFATQFPSVRHVSKIRHEKEYRENLDLEKRIARFRYDLDPVECDNFSEIMRTLYVRAQQGDFETGGDTSSVYRHISDFYAMKILAKVEITRVKPQASGVRSSRPSELKKNKKEEPVQKAKKPAKQPRLEAPRRESSIIAPSPRVVDLSGREKLQAALTKIKKQQAIEAAQKASGSPVAVPGSQSRPHSSLAIPASHRKVPEDKSFPQLTKKASSKSLRSQEDARTPVDRASPPPLDGDPMEGVTVHMASQYQDSSNGLQSKMGRLNTRRSMPTLSEGPRAKSGVKLTQNGSSAERKARDRLSHPGLKDSHSPQISAPTPVSRSHIVLDPTPPLPEKGTLRLSRKEVGETLTRKTSAQNDPKQSTPEYGRRTPAVFEKRNGSAPPAPFDSEYEQPPTGLQHPQPRKKMPQLHAMETEKSVSPQLSSHSPAIVVKAEPSDTVPRIASLPGAREASRPDTEMTELPQPEDLLTRLNTMLQLIQNEKDQDKILPERTQVPEDQARELSKHTALWPLPKKELQKHMRAIPNLEPKDIGAPTCRFPEDFEPYNSTIETSTQPGTQANQKRKETADLVTVNQPKNLVPGEQHVFTLTNQSVEDDSDDAPEGWESTPRSKLIDPFDRPNEVFENSDAESLLDSNPPPASSMQSPKISGREQTPKKVKSALVKTNTPVPSLRRLVAEKYTPPVKRIVGVPLPSSPDGDDDLADNMYQKRFTATKNTTKARHQTGDEDDEMEEVQPAHEEERIGNERGEGKEVEGDEEYDDEKEDQEEGGEEECEVQVCQTQSSPNLRYQTPRRREPQPDQVVQVTPIAISSSQLGYPGASRSSPNISKRKADQISFSPVKAGSAVSPMIRGPKVLKIDGAEQVMGTLIQRANAAIASSKEGVRQDLNISHADLAEGLPGNQGKVRAMLDQLQEKWFAGLSDSESDLH